MAKGRNILRMRDCELTVIEKYFKRKAERARPLRRIPILSSMIDGFDKVKVIPTIGAISANLISQAEIYGSGLFTTSPTNIGTFDDTGSMNRANFYHVDADDQGAFASVGFNNITVKDQIEFSVWIKGHTDGASGNTYDYLFSAYGLNDDATPSEVEKIIIRYESGTDELRLYPNYDYDPAVFVALSVADWEDITVWKLLKIQIDYQNQEFTLDYDGDLGTFSGGTAPNPDLDELTYLSFFADLNNENNGYHDFQYLYLGPIQAKSTQYSDHDLLSASHPDTEPSAVARGDLIVGNAASKWDNLVKGSIGQFLKMLDANDPGWTAHGLTYADIKRTECITYMDIQATATATILAPRLWRDETVIVFAAQPAHPRICSVSTTNCLGGISVGTVTIYGIDADGAVISEVFTINDAVPTLHSGTKAFRLITSIVTDRSDSCIGNQYSVGILAGLGLPNYPFNAASDVFAITLNGQNSLLSNWTINTTYGTAVLSLGVSAGDDVMFMYRPFK